MSHIKESVSHSGKWPGVLQRRAWRSGITAPLADHSLSDGDRVSSENHWSIFTRPIKLLNKYTELHIR